MPADAEGAFLKRFDAFLAEHGERIGAILFEPQWGSTFAGRPWPKAPDGHRKSRTTRRLDAARALSGAGPRAGSRFLTRN
mmetsp:Transcript_83254/g.226094  ORF Transcript_83254/g.226094 Transcript_83254/m.226094 type:complete len:80 (+) Transcript_83254:57-296(+)